MVTAFEVDANGDPRPDTRTVFVDGLSGAEGAVIDPVTGDFLFSTFGGSNRVIRVQGFVPPTAATTTTVLSSVNPSILGQSVTFTATVTGGASPSGTVTFQDGGNNIAGCIGVALVAGHATCTTSTLSLGGHVIAGNYSGNQGNAASTGSVTQNVNGVILIPQPAVNVPALAQWAMALLIALLAGLGAMHVRGARRPARR
jgi:hypothetical protein